MKASIQFPQELDRLIRFFPAYIELPSNKWGNYARKAPLSIIYKISLPDYIIPITSEYLTSRLFRAFFQGGHAIMDM